MQTDQTKKLLAAGSVAGPLFISVAMMQAFTREGLDIVNHPVSSLSHGDLGWLQIVNFVISGLLAIACSFGIKQVLHNKPGGTWAPQWWLLYPGLLYQ